MASSPAGADRLDGAGFWRLRPGGLGGLPGLARRFGAAFPEQFLQPGADQPAERPVRAAPVEHGHLKLAARGVGPLPVGRRGQRRHRRAERGGQRHAVGVPLLQGRGHLVGLAADGREPVLVGHRAVERDPVDLVVAGALARLRHDDLHLERLRALGEDRAELLGIPVGDAARGHVPAVELVARDVGVGHAGLAQVLVLVVPADRGERDPVVDLADLVQGAGRVRRHEQDAAGVLDDDPAAAARDSLARIVRLVFHHLFRRHVERHGHRRRFLYSRVRLGS